ncbi:hypothetical protein EIN_274870 [Entamoeba invadens IP1]|uniref:Uncharacterized protein n=1 Tax=Entamoeba invadens IP1 TaxID=370355 RepID=A0A0A1U1K0_ENTIV|nr:hypothetical protein EIN_274870 [Entamoeba invadens IP1]ELP87900.1 hypothetical protein EIN_274870 [Entamoeba invadens IP1]|eukprot:XP_004254671.1 hypothetical protein EIN_274870 [Entamoeba invadens IP1]
MSTLKDSKEEKEEKKETFFKYFSRQVPEKEPPSLYFQKIKQIEETKLTVSNFNDLCTTGVSESISDLLEILCEDSFSVRQSHLIFLSVSHKVETFSLFLDSRSDLLDIYKTVQYQTKLVPRVFLMSMVGSKIVQTNQEYSDLVLKDILNFSLAIFSPLKALLMRLFISKTVSSIITDNMYYTFFKTNVVEATRAVLRYTCSSSSSQSEKEWIEEAVYPLKELYSLFFKSGVASNDQLTIEMIPLLLSEVFETNHDVSKPLVLTTILESISPALVLSTLPNFITTLRNINRESVFTILGNLIKTVGRESITPKDFSLLYNLIEEMRDVIEQSNLFSLLQVLYQATKTSSDWQTLSSLVFKLAEPIPTPLKGSSANNLWNMLSQPIESNMLKTYISDKNFRTVVKKMSGDRMVSVAKKILDNYVGQFTIDSQEEATNLLDVCSSILTSSCKDLEKLMKVLHIVNKQNGDLQLFEILSLNARVVESVAMEREKMSEKVNMKDCDDAEREKIKAMEKGNDEKLSTCLPPIIFALLHTGQNFPKLREKCAEEITKNVALLGEIDKVRTVKIGSQITVEFSKWRNEHFSQKYFEMVERLWNVYNGIAESGEQEIALLELLGAMSAIESGNKEAIQFRVKVEKESSVLLKTTKRCEMCCKCAALSGCLSSIRDDQHVEELLRKVAMMGSNVIVVEENAKLFVLILNYFVIHFTTNKMLTGETISKIIELIKGVLGRVHDGHTLQFFDNTIKEIKERKVFDERYSTIVC